MFRFFTKALCLACVCLIIFATVGCGVDDRIRRSHHYNEGYENARDDVLRAREYRVVPEENLEGYTMYGGDRSHDPAWNVGYRKGAQYEIEHPYGE